MVTHTAVDFAGSCWQINPPTWIILFWGPGVGGKRVSVFFRKKFPNADCYFPEIFIPGLPVVYYDMGHLRIAQRIFG